jgi:RNA polymerase sigma-70 factor (ECF subfamily)
MSPTDEARFLELLREHRSILHKVAHGYCRGADERNDLVQEITIQLWRAFPRFDARVKFSTWAYRVAMNVAISHLRHERRAPDGVELSDDHATPPPPHLGEEADNMRILRRLIEGLDEPDRALVLLYLDGHSGEEIAAVLGISPANVTTRMNRLKQQLQRGFARLDPAPETAI